MIRYDSYKETGVDWIGKIPTKWDTKKLKHLIRDTFGGEVIDKSFWGEGKEVLYTTSMKPMSSNYSQFENSRRTTLEDLLLSRNGDGVVHVPNEGCIYTNVVQLVRIKKDLDRKFIFYSLTNQIKPLNSESDGDFIVSLNKERWFNLLVPTPPTHEQSLIVSYLDKKTKIIDELVTKIERKVELLKKQKTSLINEVITKGINSNVEMKYSGDEVLGNLPKHWKVRRLKLLGKFSNGLSKDSEYFGSGFPFFTYGDVYNNQSLPVKPSGLVDSDESDHKKCSVERGDIFFTRTSESTDDIGVTSTCLKTMPHSTFSGFVIRFRPHEEELLPEYSKYLFQNHYKKTFIESRMNIVTRSSLSQSILGNVLVMFPEEKEEQQEMIEYLDHQTHTIDKIILQEEKRIELLKEYKLSLISEVVTGKKKVVS